MKRCTEHDLLNCKCRESLSTFLVRQFAESTNDRVVRAVVWAGDQPEPRVRAGGNVGSGEGGR